MTRQIAAIVLGLGLGLAFHPAHAEPNAQAKLHIDAAMKAHAAGNFAVAHDELTEAYRLDPQPEILFALGQVNGKLDRCADAIDAYEKFLATSKDPDANQITTQAIAACKQTLAAHPPPAEAGPAHAPFYADTVTDALVIGGVTSTLIGLVLYSAASTQLDEAESARTLADYQSHVDAAHVRRAGAAILVTGGLALVTVGVVRFVLHRQAEEQLPPIAVVPTRDGAMLVWEGRWR